MLEEKRQYLVETDKESYQNQQEWLEEFLDDEGAFYNGAEAATGGVLYKKRMFLQNSQISRENTCVGVSFY